jgi:hypothetical protein
VVNVAELVAMLRAFAEPGTEGRTARARIAVAALDPDEVKANPELAYDLLAGELAPLLVDLLAEVTRLESEGVALDGDAEGMLALDLALVRVLERVDADEGATAREARTTKATDPALRWELWTDAATPSGLVRFAGVVWSRRVLERWRRGVDRPAAMVRAVAEPLNRLTRASFDEASGEVRDHRGDRVAGLNPDADVAKIDLEVMRRGLMAFRTTTAKRFVRYLAHEAHRGEVRGDYRPEIVIIEGGLIGLTEAIGCDARKDARRVRELLDFGRCLDVSTPGLDVHGLWTWNCGRRNAPGQRRMLEVNLNHRVFLSGAAESMRATGVDTGEARRDRLLVPVLQHDPPYRVPNHAERGRAWSVADAVLVLLVDRARDLANDGGVRIDSKGWARLVDEAGLDETRAGVVRDRLLEGDGVSPPMLAVASADRFTLASEHALELAFIVSRIDSRKRNR